MEADFSELSKLSRDLGKVAEGTEVLALKALQVTATNVKKEWGNAARRRGLRGYAAAVSYDTEISSTGISAEIGPDRARKQGVFGLVEEAKGDVKSAPQNAGRDALKNNEADFEKGLDIALAQALKALGL